MQSVSVMRWREAGRCNDGTAENVALFYGEHVCGVQCDGEGGCRDARKEKGRVDRVREAKAICARCPVCETCLDYAIVTAEQFGIWGGKTERERRAIRKQRREQTNGSGT